MSVSSRMRSRSNEINRSKAVPPPLAKDDNNLGYRSSGTAFGKRYALPFDNFRSGRRLWKEPLALVSKRTDEAIKNRGRSEILFEVHAAVETGHLIAVAVEHQCRDGVGQEAGIDAALVS